MLLLLLAIFMKPAAAVAAVAHIVVVIEENHSANEIIGSDAAPFINHVLVPRARVYTRARGVAHPSQPNYLALFSGTTQGVRHDGAVEGAPLVTPNLAGALRRAGADFIGYSEGLPKAGSLVMRAGAYARKHNPWSNWQSATPSVWAITPAANKPFSAFPSNFEDLPRVAFVVPDQNHDMHGTSALNFGPALVRAGDSWLRAHLAAYADWAPLHHSLLIITWDEEDDISPFASATMPLLVLGAGVVPGQDSRPVNHYDTLATIARLAGAAPPGLAAVAHGLLP
ncbi:MAG: alkaline phosphatase family protein [Rhodospirillales bacterium]|nr:alkaline phosphatase family protein [Rhodospirillales bacterium]